MKSIGIKFLAAAFLLSAVVFANGSQVISSINISDNERNMAAVGNPDSTGGAVGNPGTTGGAVGNPGAQSEFSGTGLQNPLKSDSIEEFLLAIIEVLLVFAVPIIVLFIMYAGFLYVTAAGDESKIKTAHSALTWAIVGGVIALGAKLIIDVIQSTIESI